MERVSKGTESFYFVCSIFKGANGSGIEVIVTGFAQDLCEETRISSASAEQPTFQRVLSGISGSNGAEVKFSEFVARHIGEMEGVLLEAETGDYLGNHRGFWFYTIGQRQGLRLPGGPWYVVEKDVQNNVVFISRNYFSLDKRRRTFRVGSLKWFSGSTPEMQDRLRCKVRHGPSFYDCSLRLETNGDGNEQTAVVHLSEDDQGLAAGQFTAFYHDNICLGSGVILDSWDNVHFPVCSKAMEIARMKDKSKLGKPIRILNLDFHSKASLKTNEQSADLQRFSA